jgi:tRNA(adenine34) deaminase
MIEAAGFSIYSDDHFMREALKEAEKAAEQDEVPVGAVIVSGGIIIARGHNLTETLHDVTAHAEMQCITAAAENLGGKYLADCTLYVTLEPCVMCAGALRWAQIGKIVYGASDPKAGYARYGQGLLHPKTVCIRGVYAIECREIISTFFKTKRN